MQAGARRLARGALRRRAEMSAHREPHKRLRSQTFSIVSDDCWGGEVYKLTGAPFATPFIGLYIIAPSYLKILRDLPTALTSELVQTKASRYPEVEQVRKDVRPFP